VNLSVEQEYRFMQTAADSEVEFDLNNANGFSATLMPPRSNWPCKGFIAKNVLVGSSMG